MAPSNIRNIHFASGPRDHGPELQTFYRLALRAAFLFILSLVVMSFL